jgi:uncharacterized protein YyaL (SSP411 family)
MTHAIRIHETGGPEVLRWEEVEVGEPAAGAALLNSKPTAYVCAKMTCGPPVTDPAALKEQLAGS